MTQTTPFISQKQF